MSGSGQRVLDGLADRLTAAAGHRRPSPARAAAATAVLLGAVALVMVADLRSGPGVSLAVFYLIPALIGALLGPVPGLLLAAAGAAGWAVGEPGAPGSSLVLHALDAALRFLAGGGAVLLVDGLRRATARAIDSDRRARDFLSLAAHQMRTPVAAMRAAAETLVAMGADPAQEPFLADVAVGAGRIGRLVNNLLWAARFEGGAHHDLRVCDPLAACRDEAERAGRRSSLSVTVGGGRTGRVELAEDVLRETVANLLDNALRHAATQIRVLVELDRRHVSVTVRDDGPGLSPAHQQEVFRRFVSFDGGMGLGLPLCRSAARAAGGDLLYEDGGFVLRLPVRPLPEAPAGATRRLAPTAEGAASG